MSSPLPPPPPRPPARPPARARLPPVALGRAGAAVVLLLAGCFHGGGDDAGALVATPGAGDPGGGVASGDLDDVRGWLVEAHPTVLHVAWTAPPGATSFVRFGLDDDAAGAALPLSTPADEGAEVDVRALGLKAGRPYRWQAVSVDADGVEHASEVGAAEVPAFPQRLPVLAVEREDDAPLASGAAPDQDADAHVLLTVLQDGDGWVAVVDRDGDYVWWVESEGGLSIPSAHPSPDGAGIVYTQNDGAGKTDYGGIVRRDWDGDAILTATDFGHHDAVQLPGEDTIATINLRVGSFDVGGHTMDVAYDEVWENDLGGDVATARRVWTFDSTQGDYPSAPWRTCDHFDAEAYHTGARDWTHSNSLTASADGRSLYLMSKNLDALLKIDRASGTMVWQMGGRDGSFTFDGGVPFADSPDAWSHGHYSHQWEGGFCMFDNGYHHASDATGEDHAHSRAIAYAFDEDTRTVRRLWHWWLPGDNDFNPLLGDCRKLPGSDWLVTATNQAWIAEVNSGGTAVWTLRTDETGSAFGRATLLTDLYTLADEGQR